MSGILRLESLTKGNTLKQGDLTLLKYRLFDADGDKLDISGKPATVRLMKNDFTLIAYEKEGLTVATDDTISFNVNKILPGGLYHLEIIVDDKYIFPSRADEGKFNVDKSSLGAELTIIENEGIDAVVRKAIDLINNDPNLIIDEDKLVGDIISNTGIGNIEEYYQQFNDVITELSEEKDYHSLPEIAGARRGYGTLVESLQNLSADMLNPNLGKLTQIHMSDELLAQIAGDAAVNAVPADGSITRQKLANNSVSQTEIDGSSIVSPNILDLENLTTGRFMYGGVGNLATLSGGSNWNGNLLGIPVNAGDIVRFNMAFQETYFVGVNDQDLVIQVGSTQSTAGYKEIIVESGVTKFYTAVFKGHLSEAMITVNQPIPEAYTPFGNMGKKILRWLEIEEDNLSNDVKTKLNSMPSNGDTVSNWVGANMITAGTSISWQDGKAYTSGTQEGQVAQGWQTHVKNKLGLESVTNIALSGRSMADGTANGTGMITGILARTDYANYDLAVIEEGTNDAKLNVPAGEIKSPGSSDFDRETFCGAMQMGIEHILSHNPNITLVLFTPLHRNNGGLNSYDSVNSVGLKLSDYRDLIIEIGELYSCKVVDLFAESGINLRTLSTDTLDGLHPNDNGYEKMGRVAANGINFA